MHPYSYRVSLSLRHPSIDPKAVTEVLGLTPHSEHRVGDPKHTPQGTLIGGSYETAYWSSVFEPPDDSDLAAFLWRIASVLRPHEAFLQASRASGGEWTLLVGLFSDGANIGATLTSGLMETLATLGLDLDLDIYAYRDDSRADATE